MRRSFDPAFFPDPEGMAAQVKELTGAEMMVSLWPSVENLSENYVTLQTNGWLVATRDGPGVTDSFAGVYTRLVDSTNPVTADRSEGEWDTLVFKGDFNLDGTDRVGIQFTNDLYTRGVGDRNLYVDSVTVNGQTNGRDHTFTRAGTEFWDV